jgi:hypothetical protein
MVPVKKKNNRFKIIGTRAITRPLKSVGVNEIPCSNVNPIQHAEITSKHSVNRITSEKVMDMNTQNLENLLERNFRNSLSRMISNPRKSTNRLTSTNTTLEKRGVNEELPFNTNPPFLSFRMLDGNFLIVMFFLYSKIK